MKLKVIFLIFNVLIGVSFLFVFLMPAFFLGWDYAGAFWASNWYLAILFVVVLTVLNVYFGWNRRLFSALEREDWDGVISVLERRIYTRRRYGNGSVRLLVNAYVVRGKNESILRLEEELKAKRPRLQTKNALILGIPHLLSNDGKRIAEYYGQFIGEVSGRDADWLRWSRSFGLMLDQRADEARETLDDLADDADDEIVQALSAYLLEAFTGTDHDESDRINACKQRLTERHSAAEWDKMVEKARGDLNVLILSKLLRDVRTWLYEKS